MSSYNDKSNDTLIDSTRQVTAAKLWRPIRPIMPINTGDDTITKLQKQVTPPTPAGTTPGSTGTGTQPLQLTSISATESPSKQQERTFSQVAVSFTRYGGDKVYSHVNIWLTNYKGNTGPVLQMSASDSPAYFLLETTKEVITITGQPIAIDGTPAPFISALSCTVKLDGVVSAPPAPEIIQPLTTTATGYQFTFAQLPAQAADVIDSYKVYRSATNDSTTADVRFVFKHAPTDNSDPIVVQDTVASTLTYYYWVSAVNTVKLESVLTPAQDTAIPSGGGAVEYAITGFARSFDPDVHLLVWTVGSGTITGSDGSSYTYTGPGGDTFSGLTANTAYYFALYYDTGLSDIVIVKSDTNSGKSPCSLTQQTTVIGAAGHIPIKVNFAGVTITLGP